MVFIKDEESIPGFLICDFIFNFIFLFEEILIVYVVGYQKLIFNLLGFRSYSKRFFNWFQLILSALIIILLILTFSIK